MAHINLLPWREALRKQKRQEFLVILGAAGIAALGAVAGMHVYMASLIDNQIERNNILKQEIALVEKKINEIKELEKQKEQLIARMKVIEELQSNRPAVVHLFDDLARLVPEGLFIDSLEQKGTRITVKGYAQSNARVSAFMRALEDSDWFMNPSLDVITKKSSGQADREFTLYVYQDSPKGDKK